MVLIGIGANLPGPGGRPALDTCQRAAAMLDGLPGFRLAGLSRWFASAPVPASDQPDYVNGVALLSARPGATVDPAALLSDLMAIEALCGRRRGAANAARTLDLDIIAVGDRVRTAPDPVLPHPRAHLRAFVLAPLADVAPGWVHPLLGMTARQLLDGLPPQDIRAL
jgi:2-amino-4-hydroxy-6-hydroxymethyldihydropteridine diphosphokinase